MKEYKKYRQNYKEDLKQTGIYKAGLKYRFIDCRYKFYKSLRITEYYDYMAKSKSNGIYKILRNFFLFRHIKLCDKYNWGIPINVFGPGLAIIHRGTIIVNGNAKVGKNCRIHVCTNIGQALVGGVSGAPKLGDNIYIGPGVKMFGPIELGDNIAIGANAVVNKSFKEGNCTLGGVPARIISYNNSNAYINNKI